MTINVLPCRSPLCANGLLSGEWVGDRWLNLYEIMLMDLPDERTGVSTVQFYVKELGRQGLDVAGFHFHWSGAPGVLAIHRQNIGMDPMEFSERTLDALNAALSNLKQVQHGGHRAGVQGGDPNMDGEGDDWGHDNRHRRRQL